MDEIDKCDLANSQSKDTAKVLLSIYRYWLRACYRCTPFGLFAGLSIGTFENKTQVELLSPSHSKKNTRLDTHFLSSFAQKTLSDSQVMFDVKWYSNNTCYEVYDKLRFIKYYIDKDTRTHYLSNVSLTEYVTAVLHKARHGATFEELVNVLVTDEISQEEAREFIREMISECLLVSELEPEVTGREYHDQLILKLKDIPSASVRLGQLVSITQRLEQADKDGVGVSSNLYQGILSDIRDWQLDFDPGKVLQCDLYKPTEVCTLGNGIKEELGKTIALLHKITPVPSQTSLQKFLEEFVKKYESREVPLLEVLDTETGLGYPANRQINSDNAPLLSNIFIGMRNNQKPISIQNNRWFGFLVKKLETATKTGAAEIELTDREINAVFQNHDESNWRSLPDSAYTLCSVLSPSPEQIDKGNFLIHHASTVGPSAATLFGRFCFINDKLSGLVKESIRQEESLEPGKVFAEVLHIPQARLGNILMRPILREYEIPVLTMPSVDENHTLPMSDLMVSVRNGKVFLRSKKLNKEIIPRLTTAHNFASNPIPHYHFLCDLQFQHLTAALLWDWGALSSFSFLPRVRYGKTILAKARWTVTLEDLTDKKEISDSELADLFIHYFEKNKMPQWLTISEGDNQLPIDTANPLCRKLVAQDLKKFKSLFLDECLFNDANLFVTGTDGKYTNELVVPWTKNKAKETPASTIPKNQFEITRQFTPGTQWHYVKVYCGVKTADLLLTDVLLPVAEELLRIGAIEKFFFLRYTDPDHHIRIRFSGKDNFFATVTNAFNEKIKTYLENRLVAKVSIDTYEREVERYGVQNIENSESIFFFDSRASLQILSLLDGDKGDDLRWQFAVKGVHDILESFEPDLAAKQDFMSRLSASFLKEFGATDIDSKKQLSAKYRGERAAMQLAMLDEIDESHSFFSVWQIFEDRKRNIRRCVSHINELTLSGSLEVRKFDLIASYIHMFVNRFLRSKQRLQEAVIYDLLNQHYKSMIAQENKGKKIQIEAPLAKKDRIEEWK